MAVKTLSAAYFVNRISIPNISGNIPIEQANLKTLQMCIAENEPDYLKKLLGLDLYTAYAAGIVGTPDARWTALNDKIYREFTNPVWGVSPSAYYVYFFFMRNNNSVTLANTEVQATHENFTQYGSGQKMIHAWNEMVRLSDEVQSWIIENIADYPEFNTAVNKPAIYPEKFSYINSHGF